MLKILTGLTAGALLCASVSVFAQTADDCIQKYLELQEAFVAQSGSVPPDCVQDGHIIALDAEGGVNDIPTECLSKSEDHWHLKAKAILGPNPACIVQLLGLNEQELVDWPTCGTAEIRMDLPANEGAKWRNYLREQCPKAGE